MEKSRSSIVRAIDVCLRTSVTIAPEYEMTSLTYKVIIISVMMFGFIVFRHYEALLATTLIIEFDNMPYQTWSDVLQSGKKILVWETANSEKKFSVPSNGSILRTIYDKQIGFMDDIGYERSIPGIVDGQYAVFESLTPYELAPEYPCQIVAANSHELR